MSQRVEYERPIVAAFERLGMLLLEAGTFEMLATSRRRPHPPLGGLLGAFPAIFQNRPDSWVIGKTLRAAAVFP